MGEHSADSVSERVDLWVGRRKKRREAYPCQVHASLGLVNLSEAQCPGFEKKTITAT